MFYTYGLIDLLILMLDLVFHSHSVITIFSPLKITSSFYISFIIFGFSNFNCSSDEETCFSKSISDSYMLNLRTVD